MHAFVRRGLQIALVVGGGVLFSAQAQADETTGVGSVLGGEQAVVQVDAPVTVGGNAVSVIGDSDSSDSSASGETSGGSAGSSSTSGEDSAGGGSQVAAPVTAPVTVGGNAVSVVGDSSTEDADTAPSSAAGTGTGTGGSTTSGEDSVAGGNHVAAPVSAPVTVGGNAVTVVGDSSTENATTPRGEDTTSPTSPVDPAEPIDPGTPVDPAEPTDPGGVVSPAGPGDGTGTSANGFRSAGAVTGPVTADTLARTGAVAGPVLATGVVLLVAGALLLSVSRRRVVTVP